MTTNDNHKHSTQGVTLVEMGLICMILAAIIIAVMLSLSSFSKNQAIDNDAKLDKQSVDEIIRAANNYFAVCTKDSSVTIKYLQDHQYLAITAEPKEISWENQTITAKLSAKKLAEAFTVSVTYHNKDKSTTTRKRYAYLLQADKQSGNTFSWIRSVGNFKSYEATDTNLGPQMGNYIQLMNNSAKKMHTTGAKPCQSQ